MADHGSFLFAKINVSGVFLGPASFACGWLGHQWRQRFPTLMCPPNSVGRIDRKGDFIK